MHYNPVKHGHVTCPHLWPYSTFENWIKRGVYERAWLCSCDGRAVVPPTFAGLNEAEIEMGE